MMWPRADGRADEGKGKKHDPARRSREMVIYSAASEVTNSAVPSFLPFVN